MKRRKQKEERVTTIPTGVVTVPRGVQRPLIRKQIAARTSIDEEKRSGTKEKSE